MTRALPPLKSWRWRGLSLGLLASLLMGCQAAGPAATPGNLTREVTPQSAENSADERPAPTGEPDLAQIAAAPTEVLADLDPEDNAGALINEQLATPAPDPLRFSFPSPGAPPVSAWRPALYPTPWAPTPYDHFYLSRPIAADEINWPLADYRYGGVFLPDVVHTGVDIPTDIGTPVLAAGSGEVTWAGYGLYRGVVDVNDPYGLAVLIRHDFGYKGETLYTLYGHLDRVDVIKGQYLQTGEQLGLSGQTGKVTGPHLHFEVRLGKDGVFTTRNPELWLVPPQGWGVLVGRVMTSGGRNVEDQLVAVRSLSSNQIWRAKTYSRGAARSDAYYRENLVISDLPAGRYELHVNYQGNNQYLEIEIFPGEVSFFSYWGFKGYSLDPPPLPGEEFTPDP